MLRIKDIFDASRSVLKVCTIRQSLYLGGTLKPALEPRDQWQVRKLALRFATMGTRLVTKAASDVVLVFPSIAHAGVNAAIIAHGLDLGEQCKTTHCNVFGVYVKKFTKCVSHLVECMTRHGRHVLELESSCVDPILVSDEDIT